jgi:helicase
MDVLKIVKEANNFESFNPMQKKAIEEGLLENSIIVSSPTASGKTIIAEIGILQSVLNKRKKAVYTCPLRALAAEHAHDFKRKYSEKFSIHTALSTGDFDSKGENLGRNDVIFTTYEKLDSLITHKANWISNIGCLIIDEIHCLGTDRGSTLEMLIVKIIISNPSIQIIGLSATIPNAFEIAQWLEAKPVQSNYRPVKLLEGIFLDGKIIFPNSVEEIKLEEDEISSLALDTLKKGKQALIFANSRKMSESNSKKLARISEKYLTEDDRVALSKAAKEILSVLEEPTEQCNLIASLIKQGSCFHHAGLLQKQRIIIENLFKENHLKFISSTPTLAAGVNLPAFRVIIQSLYRYGSKGRYTIPVFEYKQMAGRAGRPKYDLSGESIIIAKNETEKENYSEYFVNGEVEPVNSSIAQKDDLSFHLLAAISSGFIFDIYSAEKFFSKTFYAHQYRDISLLYEKIKSLLFDLEKIGFIKTNDARIEATVLGARIAELYLDPIAAHKIISYLKKKNLHDFSYLFIVAEYFELDHSQIQLLQSEYLQALSLLEEYREFIPVNGDEMSEEELLVSRVWTASILNDWISEVKEQAICDTYGIKPGFLMSMVENADWLVYSLHEIARILDIKEHLPRLKKLHKRIKKGIREELIHLCEFNGIGRVRARRLFNAGVKTISDVKKTDIKDLQKVLGEKTALKVKKQLEIKK